MFMKGGLAPANAANADPQWDVTEKPVAVAPGDQVAPSLSGTTAIYRDNGSGPAGIVVLDDLANPGNQQELFGPGILAGPDVDGDLIAWQDLDSNVCARSLQTGSESCVNSAAAASLALSGDVAVTGEAAGGSTISRINFTTGRSRKLDSHARPGMRFDPDIDGNQAVWVRMRGYGSQYYEPVIVAYDVSDDTWSYLTATGGGGTAGGESIYQRGRPTVSDGRVLHQQRENLDTSDWDIYEAVADTYGIPVVAGAGDQMNPSLDGNLVVWQDNRNGHTDGAGNWVDEWDIYIMDLDTGRQQLLVGAPGDQVEPEISGNRIIWQDNRNGDWDIYAAEITPAGSQPGGSPDLVLSRGGVFWESYDAYSSHELSVDYYILNRGDGPAGALTLATVVCEPSSVTLAAPLPVPVQVLDSGQKAQFRLRYAVPEGVGFFRTRLYANCLDPDGGDSWYPAPPPS